MLTSRTPDMHVRGKVGRSRSAAEAAEQRRTTNARGGRGSARGVVRKGHPYRDEFTTAVQILFCVVQVLCYVVGLVLSRIEPEGYLPMLSGGGDN